MTKALVLTSNLRLSAALKVILTCNKFNVLSVAKTAQARKHLCEVKFDFVIVDIHRQDENAFSFIKSIRDHGIYVPVLYLGERNYEDALVLGINGEDEYLLHPFTFGELKTKINKLLTNHQERKILIKEDVCIDIARQWLVVKDQIVFLGQLEMKILVLLTRKSGTIIPGERIKSVIEAEGMHFNRTVFFYIHELSKKLEKATDQMMCINLTRGGYCLEVSSI